MITFGLTGGIASGKSTVTKTFRANNIPMVDADIAARDVVVPGSYGLELIVRDFGPEYLNADGTLDRIKLGKLVFADKDALARINEIMMPLINTESNFQIAKLHSEGHYIVGYDGALICEMGNSEKFRPLIVVHCPRDTQAERLMKRNSLTRQEAMLRIDAQMPVEKKIELADYTIDTSKTLEDSVKQTETIVYQLQVRMYQKKMADGEIFLNQIPSPWRESLGL
jgi:dephospho-CoA kinase